MSLHADLTNRGPTFDMDLSELEHDGQPISYEAARQYFKRDPAHRSVHASQLSEALKELYPSCNEELPCSLRLSDANRLLPIYFNLTPSRKHCAYVL